MSDIDENLTSILSSLIDADGIEISHSAELQENGSFNDSRLDFDNLASCITGNDASLHQSSDENVSSLLESHLNELSRTGSSGIIETGSENLDDVTSFDLDKPIEALLESASTEFISQECSESQIPAIAKTIDLQNVSCSSSSVNLNEIQHNAKDASDAITSILHTISSNENVNSNANEQENQSQNYVSQIDAEQSSKPSQFIENEMQELFESNEAVSREQYERESNLNGENETTEVIENRDEPSEYEEEAGETIIAETTKKPSLAHHAKKRRRIMVYDEQNTDNDELEDEREKLLQSKSPTHSHHSSEPNDEANQSDLSNDEYSYQSDTAKADNFDDDYDFIRDPNEKPGPKSKKLSTHLYNAQKAKALLESAIVIPACKKKKRVIDSDDEYNEFALNQPTTSVDDIGLIPDDNNVMPFNVSIETDLQGSIVSIKSEHEVEIKPVVSNIRVKSECHEGKAVKIELDKDYVKPSFIKVEPLARPRAQVKNHTNSKRRSSKRKESKDYFGMSLNAPYVDSSSDEDYFASNETTSKRTGNHGLSQRTNNGNSFRSSATSQKKRKGYIPDDIYFNAKVPLHILYSYDDSSSDDERKRRSASHATSPKTSTFQPTIRLQNKMPTVHRIIPRTSHGKSTKAHKVVPKNRARSVKNTTSQPTAPSKSTVFEQLDKLKRLLKASGIKVNVNDLLKGSKTFQERCEKIRNVLYRNGIEGEPTLAKCKKLKKTLKLKEEIAGLDPSVIIDAKEEEGRPKRRATRRNYVFDEPEDAKKQQTLEIKEDATQLLQKMKKIVDSDSEYEGNEFKQNSNNNANNDNNNTNSTSDPANMVEAIISPNESNTHSEMAPILEHAGQMPISISVPLTIQSNVTELLTIAQCTTTDLEQL